MRKTSVKGLPVHPDRPKPEDQVNTIIARQAAVLSVVEIGLGSLLHGFGVPLAGQALSLNQGCFLIQSHKRVRTLVPRFRHTPFYVSSIVAVLKSLSPAGKKLGPMLSISAQGFLFWLGLVVGGSGTFGICLGMMLLSLWAFVQPFLTLYLFFGHSLVDAGGFFLQKFESLFGLDPQFLLWPVIGLILLKVTIALGLGLWISKMDSSTPLPWEKKSQNAAKIKLDLTQADSSQHAAALALRDMTKPLFLISFVLMCVFFIFSRSEHAQTIWILLRPLGVAFLFFFISRHPAFYKWAKVLLKWKPMHRWGKILRATREEVKNHASK